MKKFLIIVLLTYVTSVSAQDNSQTTNAEAKRIAQEIYDIYDNANCQNPDDEFISGACAVHNDELSNALILMYATEKVILSYYDETKSRMEQKSADSGRKIESDNSTITNGELIESFWLNRGDLDSKKCQWDFKKKIACEYPDGFEEFSVRLFDSNPDGDKDNSIMTFDIHIDNPTDQKVNIISVSLLVNKDNATDSYMISVVSTISGTEYNYQEYYAWQNQTAKDIRNGKMIKVPKKQRKATPGFDVEWMMDESREWASSHIPAYASFSRTLDARDMRNKTRN